MAEYGAQNETISLPAAADLSACQYHLMRITSTGTVNIASSPLNGSAIGVLTNKPTAAGRFATIAFSGKGKVVAGAAVAIGNMLMCDASGRAVPVTSAANMVIGRALSAAANTGEIITAVLCFPMNWGKDPAAA